MFKNRARWGVVLTIFLGLGLAEMSWSAEKPPIGRRKPDKKGTIGLYCLDRTGELIGADTSERGLFRFEECARNVLTQKGTIGAPTTGWDVNFGSAPGVNATEGKKVDAILNALDRIRAEVELESNK